MAGHDERTGRYFERCTPVYSRGRYKPVIEFLQHDADAGSSLLDVGCGSGNVLGLIARKTPVGELAGLDVSPAYLEQCAAAVPGCQTFPGSILDLELHAIVGRRFRYVLIGAVLHHLVGATREESLAYARNGLAAAWSLVEHGGALLVMEPTFRPRWSMNMLFHAKRLVGPVASGRVSVFGYWNNLGEPLVSYFSHRELAGEIERLGGAEIVVDRKKTKKRPAIWRLAGITERADSVLIARKSA